MIDVDDDRLIEQNGLRMLTEIAPTALAKHEYELMQSKNYQ